MIIIVWISENDNSHYHFCRLIYFPSGRLNILFLLILQKDMGLFYYKPNTEVHEHSTNQVLLHALFGAKRFSFLQKQNEGILISFLSSALLAPFRVLTSNLHC
jgi:hypothetical protein